MSWDKISLSRAVMKAKHIKKVLRCCLSRKVNELVSM